MKVPNQGVYYYESPDDQERLLRWMPREELEASPTGKKILNDYPDGLDLEVSQEEFDFFKAKYGLDLGVEADFLLVAFEALQCVDDIPSGEQLVRSIVEEHAREIKGARTELKLGLKSALGARKVLDEEPEVRESAKRKVRELMGDGAPGAGEATEEPPGIAKLHVVETSGGDDELAVFNKLQRRSTREK
jgi:hypothetical protein